MDTIAKLLLLHFIADFVLQPREMGKKKSEDARWLAGHLAIQFAVFAPFTSILFALANCAVHGLIDWYIWKGYKLTAYKRIIKAVTKKLEHARCLPGDDDFQEALNSGVKDAIPQWKFWEDHLFYTTIGFDQLLHGLTLVTLAGWVL